MDEGAKRRLVGAAVLVALAVIFVPMFLDDKDADGLGEPIVIPDSPTLGDTESGEDLTPLLPSPESPTDGMGQGFGATAADAGLPAPLPPDQDSASLRAPTPSEGVIQTQPQPASPPRAGQATQPPAQPAPVPARAAAAGPKPVPPGSSAWVIQVASLGSSAAATKLQDDLRAQGYPAFVEQATVNGKRYFRVRVGPETSRAKANGIAAKLQRETVYKPLVQTYR